MSSAKNEDLIREYGVKSILTLGTYGIAGSFQNLPGAHLNLPLAEGYDADLPAIVLRAV
jgi:hypothetical protein